MKKSKKKVVGGKALATLVDYQLTFDSPHGRRVLWHLMKMHGYMEPSYVPGDSHGTAFNDGSRNVLNQIFKKLKVNVVEFEKRVSDHQEETDNDIFER